VRREHVRARRHPGAPGAQPALPTLNRRQALAALLLSMRAVLGGAAGMFVCCDCQVVQSRRMPCNEAAILSVSLQMVVEAVEGQGRYGPGGTMALYPG
jgi:hypothetical protein